MKSQIYIKQSLYDGMISVINSQKVNRFSQKYVNKKQKMKQRMNENKKKRQEKQEQKGNQEK